MEKFELILNSIDWVFAFIILVGGRYFGSKYFRMSKHDAVNFLGFATLFGGIWLAIKYYTVGIAKEEVGNLFITYLVTTSFYELMAKMALDWVDAKMGKKKTTETVIKVEGKITEVQESKPDEKKPD